MRCGPAFACLASRATPRATARFSQGDDTGAAEAMARSPPESRALAFQIGCGDVGASNIGDGPRAAVPHGQLEFTLKNFKHALHSRFTECSQPPQERASYPHGL